MWDQGSVHHQDNILKTIKDWTKFVIEGALFYSKLLPSWSYNAEQCLCSRPVFSSAHIITCNVRVEQKHMQHICTCLADSLLLLSLSLSHILIQRLPMATAQGRNLKECQSHSLHVFPSLFKIRECLDMMNFFSHIYCLANG